MNELITVQENTAIVERQTVGAELFDRFIAYLDTAPKTIQTYTRALRQLFNYFYLNGINQPTREDIIAFRDELKASGHKPTTVQNYITATKIFFSWTEQEGLYPNVADHLKGAKLDRDHKKDYLTSRQVKEVFAAATTNYKEEVLFVVNYRTDLTTAHAVRYKGILYDITRIDTFEGYKEDLTLYCSRRARQS